MADRAPLLCSSGRKGGFVPAFPAKDLRHSDWTGSGRMPSLEPIILAEGHGWRQFLWKLMDPRMEFWGLMEMLYYCDSGCNYLTVDLSKLIE